MGIQRKIMLFLGLYTMALLISVLGFSITHGFQTVRDRVEQRIRDRTDRLSLALEDDMSVARAELRGLVARVEQTLYQQSHATPNAETMDAMLEFLSRDPRACGSLALGNLETLEVTRVRMVSELGELHSLVQNAQSRASLDEVLSPVGLTPESIPRDVTVSCQPLSDAVWVFVPIPLSQKLFLTAELRLSSLLIDVVHRLSPDAGEEILITDPKGMVIFSTNMNHLRKQASQLWDGDLARAMEAQEQVISRWDSLVLVRPLPNLPLMTVMRKSMHRELTILRSQMLAILSFTTGLAIAAYLLARNLSSRLSSSLQVMTRVAARVGDGDFDARIPIQTNDEIGVLIDAFNAMIADLGKSDAQLRKVNRELANRLDELKRTRLELSQKQKLALVGEAVSRVSHEIQNRMGGVGIWVQNLERMASTDEPTRQCISEIKVALHGFNDMLVNFKRFYRRPQLVLRSFDLKDFTDRLALQVASETMTRDITLKFDPVPQAAQVTGDPQHLLDAALNLLLNALDATEDGGCVEIKTRLGSDQLSLAVCDRGPGVNPADLPDLLQPFSTGKPNGSGLGLAIVYNIVTAHGGDLCCTRRAHGGVCFEMRIPQRAETTSKEGA